MNDLFTLNRLFAEIPPALVTRVTELITTKTYEPEEVIIREGDTGECLFLVGEGSVRISKKGRGGRQETLTYIMPGDFFGEMSLVDRQPRSAQATAAEHTVLGCVSPEALQKALDLAPESLALNFIRTVVHRLRNTDSLFINEMMRTERLSLVGLMSNTIIHDFLNPMSVILCANDFMQHKCGNAGCMRMTQLIKKSVEQMMSMAQELLAFSRGTATLALEPVPIARLLSELDEQALSDLGATGIRVEKEITFDGELTIDLHRFLRMLLNLVKNAKEAMPDGGLLRLTVRPDGEDVIFQLRDTGVGMPPQLMGKMFEPFQSHGKQYGTGLGMAVAKSVAEAHHGQISVQSELGKGTTLTIRIPKTLPAPAGDGALPATIGELHAVVK